MAKVRVFRVPPRRSFSDVIVYVGPFACRYVLHGKPVGYFSNGSRWSSGWHRWRDDLWPDPESDEVAAA